MNDFIEQVLKEDFGFTDSEVQNYIKCRDKLQQEALNNLPELDTISLSVRNTCEWKYECPYEIGYYDTECGSAYCFEEGTIEENDYKFCPYCGKRIVEKGIKE